MGYFASHASDISISRLEADGDACTTYFHHGDARHFRAVLMMLLRVLMRWLDFERERIWLQA